MADKTNVSFRNFEERKLDNKLRCRLFFINFAD